MNKRKQETANLIKKQSVFASLLGDGSVTETTYTKGSVQFSSSDRSTSLKLEDLSEALLEKAKLHLDWQGFNELEADHGLSLCYQILSQKKYQHLGERNTKKMFGQIQKEITPEICVMVKSLISKFDKNSGHKEIYIRALWAQLFSEPFEAFWLAASALHAFYVEEDEYAFGYLVAQIDQKEWGEQHLLRGQDILENARRGGEIRSKQQSQKTGEILQEMARLIKNGNTIRGAAKIVFARGKGSSEGANKQIWKRRPKK